MSMWTMIFMVVLAGIAFAAWKRGDAAALEHDLVKMACDLTASAMSKVSDSRTGTHSLTNTHWHRPAEGVESQAYAGSERALRPPSGGPWCSLGVQAC